jgi:hypothetical protein
MIFYLQPPLYTFLMEMMSAAQFYYLGLVWDFPFLHNTIQAYRALPQSIPQTILYCTGVADTVYVAV